MNIYEPYERVSRCGHQEKKFTRFFFFGGAKKAIFCFIRFISFIKSLYEAKKGLFVRQLWYVKAFFMNIMNTYEGGVYKRFFGKVGLGRGDFMNLKMGVLHKCS